MKLDADCLEQDKGVTEAKINREYLKKSDVNYW